MSDQHVALGILLELAVQRGSLEHMLEVILLLLELWDTGQDNDTDSCFTSAPLIHLLRRFDEITSASQKSLETNKLADEVRSLKESVIIIEKYMSNICFLKIEHEFFSLIGGNEDLESKTIHLSVFRSRAVLFHSSDVHVPVLALSLHFIHLLLSLSL